MKKWEISKSNFRKKTKKMLLFSTSFVLLSSSVFNPITTDALNKDDLKISVEKTPNIDIALTLGITQVPSIKLEDDLLEELEKRGIDKDRVQFQSFNSTSVSTNDADATQIFNTWENYPNDVGKWQLTTFDGTPVIRSTRNTQWTGFWKEDDAKHTEIKSQLAVTTSDGDGDWVGMAFRMKRYEPGHPENPYEGNIDAYDMYAFAIDGGNSGESALFKLTKVPFENNKVGDHQMWNPNHNTGKGARSAYFTQNGTELPVQHIGTIPDSEDVKGTIVSLQRTNTKNLRWKRNEFLDLEIKVVGNYIQVWVDGKKEIEYFDEDNPFLSGGYGPYAASQSHGTHRDLVITKKDRKSFLEILLSPQWRENSEKFIVNLDDEINPSFDDPHENGEITSRLINEEIDYIGVGSIENEEQTNKLIRQINHEGVFIDSNQKYDEIIKDTADYIESELVKKSGDGSNHILMGEPVNLTVQPSEYQKNTENSKYPQGRWRIDHDENYYHNSLGQYVNSGVYQPDLDFSFNLPGKYELWFEDIHPSPRYIYVHRRPIANFSLNITERKNDYKINIEDLSYDLDLEHQANKGIAEREWRWKETTSPTWNKGKIPTTLPKGKTYIVQLRVKDHQGVWSRYESRYFTTDSVKTKPFATFDIPKTAFIDEPINVNDTSYDPSGEKIVEREWIYTKRDKEVYKGSQPITDFKDLGVGEYKIQLRVKNESGIWSDPFTRTIEIKPELIGEISITPSTSDWTNKNIELHVEGKNISKLLTPDNIYVAKSSLTYTVHENGEYTFVGFNERGKVAAIVTYVVTNIDRTGREAVIIPGDGKWKNKDVEVQIRVN